MKLGILTQPLKNNYGGLIQAYALKKTLEKFGHEVIIINRVGFFRKNQTLIKKILSKLKKIIYKIINKDQKLKKETANLVNANCIKFVEKHIAHVSETINSNKALLAYVSKNQFDGYVVGSDQVWRPIYSGSIENYFLDFCSGQPVKRIAYAASFGVDTWEFTKKETFVCSALAKRFNGISVREDSGIDLCREYLGVEAMHVLDPTMLLEKEEYEQIVYEDNVPKSKGNLFYYFLDDNLTKQNLIRSIEDKYSMESFDCMPAKKALFERDITTPIDDYIFPSPSKWLRSFMDADMVLTDSFHGTVFSIIFNKPVWVIYNAHRGNTRFDSLLKMFNLTDRIIDPANCLDMDFNKPIDWNMVNSILLQKKSESLEFITKHLS